MNFFSCRGVNIVEFNLVRIVLSCIKGGGLVWYCKVNNLIMLIIFDVLGDLLEVIVLGLIVMSDFMEIVLFDVLCKFDFD